MSDERRRKIDPAQAMIEDYKKSEAGSQVGKRAPHNNAISPDKRERERLRELANEAPKDLNELESYLKQINIDDLQQIARERKSSKKLDGGPNISGVKA